MKHRLPRSAAAVAGLALVSSTALAEVLVVTVGTDSVDDPAPGSLRHVLTRQAKAGDTIRFASPFAITLDPEDVILTIGDSLNGLTIEGPAELRGPGQLLIKGDAITLRGMRFTDLEVHCGDVRDVSSVLGLRTDDFVCRDCTFSGASRLELVAMRGALVQDCTFDVRAPRGRNAVSDDASEGSRWLRNTWSESSRGGFFETECTGFVFEDGNKVVGDATFWTRSGRIAGNEVSGRLAVERPTQLKMDGPVLVQGNTCGALRAARPDIEIVQNTVTGVVAPGSAAGRVTPFNAQLAQLKGDATSGYMRLRGNVVTASDAWIQAAQIGATSLATELLVDGNTFTAGRLRGVLLRTPRAATLRNNTIRGSGSSAALYVAEGALGGISLDGDRVEGGRGAGIVLAKGAGAATLTNVSVTDCAGPALRTDGRRLVSDGGSYESSATGVVVGKKTQATIRGGSIRGNRGSGVFADAASVVEVARTSFGGNGGAGIDLAPGGVTPNAIRKRANGNVPFPTALTFDEGTGRVTGKAEPGARIDAYAVEEGARAGNPENGEGSAWLGEVFADANGDFTFPSGGRAPCPPSKKLTFTATRVPQGPVSVNAKVVTSEFSEDVECKEGTAVELVSKSASGEVANQRADTTVDAIFMNGSAGRIVSAGGRFAVFSSEATNLDPGPHTERVQYVFLRDTTLGTTTRVSRTHHGGAFRMPSGLSVTVAGDAPTISDDGRWIAYLTSSDEVIPGDEDGYPTVVLFDAETGRTVAVTDPRLRSDPFPDGRYGHLGGSAPAVSGDGGTVVFTSIDGNWVGDTDVHDDSDVFAWTRATGAFERVSVPTGGGDQPGPAYDPRVSRDGRFVSFTSFQTLEAGAPPGCVYLRDRQSGATTLVSRDAGGMPRAAGNSCLSDDGRYVAFETPVGMVSSDTDGRSDVYVVDRQENTLTRVSLRSDASPFPAACFGATMSGDGSRIAFVTTGQFDNPSGPSVGNIHEVWLADRTAGTVAEASVSTGGDANQGATAGGISRDGSSILFTSSATNLVPEVTTFNTQVYLRRLPGSP